MNPARLTATCQDEGFSSAAMVSALEQGWAAIREHHPQVPAAVIVVGSGSPTRASGAMVWGHFVQSQWQYGQGLLSEVLISGEGLARTVDEVLATLLHEATHGLAFARGIQDTSRQGRWHNKQFATLAAELGLSVTKSDKLGWSGTTLGVGTLDRYSDVVVALDAALKAYRHPTLGGAGNGRTASNNGVVLECGCPRKIRTSASVAELGPIVCGVCEGPFVGDDQ